MCGGQADEGNLGPCECVGDVRGPGSGTKKEQVYEVMSLW